MSRRQRRAAATTNSTSHEISSASEIPMARPQCPTFSKTKAKTLYDIAAERQAELSPPGQPLPKECGNGKGSNPVKLVTLTSDGKITETTLTESETISAAEGTAPTVPLHPLLDTLLVAAPLSALNFTLSFLTFHQYAQPDLLSIPTLLKQTLLVALPTLTLLIHITHGHALPSTTLSPRIHSAWMTAQQLVFVITANIAGCYLIYLTNDRGYYAVMKRAPAIGTLWVWCILELGLVGALAGVVGPGLFAWSNGYGVF